MGQSLSFTYALPSIWQARRIAWCAMNMSTARCMPWLARVRRIEIKATAGVFLVRPSGLWPYLVGRTAEVEKALYLRQWGVPFDAVVLRVRTRRDLSRERFLGAQGRFKAWTVRLPWPTQLFGQAIKRAFRRSHVAQQGKEFCPLFGRQRRHDPGSLLGCSRSPGPRNDTGTAFERAQGGPSLRGTIYAPFDPHWPCRTGRGRSTPQHLMVPLPVDCDYGTARSQRVSSWRKASRSAATKSRCSSWSTPSRFSTGAGTLRR